MGLEVTVDLSSLPYFFLAFYVVLPLVVYFFMGLFWTRVYMVVSAFLGGMLAYATPLGFVDLLIPDVVPANLEEYFKGLFSAVLHHGLLVFSGAVFIALLLFQWGLVKLVSALGWGGAED